jgi:hypothetical protein
MFYGLLAFSIVALVFVGKKYLEALKNLKKYNPIIDVPDFMKRSRPISPIGATGASATCCLVEQLFFLKFFS